MIVFFVDLINLFIAIEIDSTVAFSLIDFTLGSSSLDKESVSIIGKVWIHEIDESDVVTGVYLESNFEHYVIENKDIVRELAYLLGSSVKVTGTIISNKSGKKILKAISYEKINSSDISLPSESPVK